MEVKRYYFICCLNLDMPTMWLNLSLWAQSSVAASSTWDLNFIQVIINI